MTAVALVVGAYLLGSVPFSYLVVRGVRGIDLRSVGSGNPGATNALRAAGPATAVAALTLDFGKGLAPVLMGEVLGLRPALLAAIGLAAVVGHVLPIFLGLSGGKGVATAAGALTALAPLAAAASLTVFIVLVLWTRYVSLGSIVAVAAAPAFLALAGRLGWAPWPQPEILAGVVAIALLVVVRHAENVRRLLAGNERRIGDRARLEGS